jgi:hypothetical protein
MENADAVFSSPAVRVWSHGWCLWQLRAEYLLAEVRRKLRKQSMYRAAASPLKKGEKGGRWKVKGTAETPAAASAEATVMPAFSFAARGEEEDGEEETKTERALSETEESREQKEEARATRWSAQLSPSHSRSLPSSASQPLTILTFASGSTPPASRASSPTPRSPSSSPSSSSSTLTLSASAIGGLIATIPPHHGQLTLPVIDSLFVIGSVVVPPSALCLPLCAALADCLLLPLPPALASITPAYYSAPHHFVSEEGGGAGQLVDGVWKRPEGRISIVYDNDRQKDGKTEEQKGRWGKDSRSRQQQQAMGEENGRWQHLGLTRLQRMQERERREKEREATGRPLIAKGAGRWPQRQTGAADGAAGEEMKEERKEERQRQSPLQQQTDALKQHGREQRIGWLAALTDQLMSAVDAICRQQGEDAAVVAADEETLARFILLHRLTHLLTLA